VTTLNWPGFGIASISWSLDRPAQVNRSAYTGVRAVATNPWHGKWSAKVQLATQQGDAAFQAARAFFTSLKGQVNNFHLPAVESPQNNNSGVTINVSAAAGATLLQLAGVTDALVVGNMMTVNGQLLSITAVNALDTSTHLQTISEFEPPLRTAATATTPVETAKPYALMALSDSSFTWDIGQWRQYGLSFAVDEAIGDTDGASASGDIWNATFTSSGSVATSNDQIIVKQAGVAVGSAFTTLNFASGASVASTGGGSEADITISASTVPVTGGGSVQADIDAIFGIDIGTAPSGSSQSFTQQRTLIGATDGTTIYYGRVSRVTVNGANALTEVRTDYNGLEINTTATVATAIGAHRYVWLQNSGNVTNVIAQQTHIRIDGSGGVTGTARFFDTAGITLGGTGIAAVVTGYNCGAISDATRVGAAYCFRANDQVAGPSIVAGFRSDMASGTNKWGFYGAGTAQNAMQGKLALGILTAPAYGLDANSSDPNFVAAFTSTHASTPSGIRILFSAASPNNVTQEAIRFGDSTAVRFRVWSNGNVVNTNNSYGAISDEKLKADIKDAGPQLADIMALRVRNFRLKADGENAPRLIGLVAQEVEEVSPGLVSETPDFEKYFEQEYERGGVGEPDNIPIIGKGEWKERPTGTFTKSVNYSVASVKLLKAFQELAAAYQQTAAELERIKRTLL
jgi:hypothetical protein